jgi:hypothetical protein
MRALSRAMIERVERPALEPGLSRRRDPATCLADEIIRAARLAAALHMVRAGEREASSDHGAWRAGAAAGVQR